MENIEKKISNHIKGSIGFKVEDYKPEWIQNDNRENGTATLFSFGKWRVYEGMSKNFAPPNWLGDIDAKTGEVTCVNESEYCKTFLRAAKKELIARGYLKG